MTGLFQDLIDALKTHNDDRQNLSRIRKEIREAEDANQAQKISAQAAESLTDEDFAAFLSTEDGKARKNAALFIADLSNNGQKARANQLLEIVWSSYVKEDTLFARSAYLKALKALDCQAYVPQMKEHLSKLQNAEMDEEDKKHIRAERKELEELLRQSGELGTSHTWKGITTKHDILLTAEPWAKDQLAETLGAHGKVVPRGVRVTVTPNTWDKVVENHTFREVLFYVPIRRGDVITADSVAEVVMRSKMMDLVEEMLGQGPFAFRLDLRPLAKEGNKKPATSKLTHKIAAEIEEASKGSLINAPGDYEIEIRLYEKKDGTYAMFLRVALMPDERFAYRKFSEPTSMHPVVAAQMVAAVAPYFKQDAQVLDPLAGVGTLLIERSLYGQKTGDLYALDTYGQAVEEGRANAEAAGVMINYINRNFFDFKHDYMFDEIITECPQLHTAEKEEKNAFYHRFFRQAGELLVSDGLIFMLSDEDGLIKKQIRLKEDFRLLRQIPVDKRREIYIIRRK